MTKAFDTPSTVSACDGVVLIDGPGASTIVMTPRAAVETSNRILQAAADAFGQGRAPSG